KVLQIRSVELAMNHKTPVRVRSTFSDDPGTLVTDVDDQIERVSVRGVSHSKNDVKMTLRQIPDQPGISAKVFNPLSRAEVNVDVIVQNTSANGTTDLSFTVERPDRVKAEEILRAVAAQIGAAGCEIDADVGKVSIIGVGMRSHPGVAAEMFDALGAAKI